VHRGGRFGGAGTWRFPFAPPGGGSQGPEKKKKVLDNVEMSHKGKGAVFRVRDGVANPLSSNEEDGDTLPQTRPKSESIVSARKRAATKASARKGAATKTTSNRDSHASQADADDAFGCWERLVTLQISQLLLWVVGILMLISISYCSSLVVRGEFSTLAALGTPFAAVIAVLGYFCNYCVQKKATEHSLMQKRMVERTHGLYGPCLMLFRLNYKVWKKIGPEKASHPFAVECLFHPINLKVQAKIMQYSQYIYADCSSDERDIVDEFIAHVELQKGKVELICRQRVMASRVLSAIASGSQFDDCQLSEATCGHNDREDTAEDAKVSQVMQLIEAWNKKNDIQPLPSLDDLEQTHADFEEMKKLFHKKFNLFLGACEELSKEHNLVAKLQQQQEQQQQQEEKKKKKKKKKK
jgi:hypothetical protein